MGLHSTVDNRQARSLFEWIPISETALEEGIGVASKKYSGITEDGREVGLSNKRIKDMIPIAADFALKFPYYWTGFLQFCVIISEVISSDATLLEVYYGIEKYYEEEANRKQKQVQEHSHGQGLSEESTDIRTEVETKDDSRTREYKYTYFYVRHYDEILYQNQKQDGVKHPNGRRECGPFKESDFSNDIVEQFERTRRS
jgi:hypothetical protein